MEATNLTPAPVWRRAAAMLYDSLLILALLFMAGFINLFIQIQIFGNEQLKTMTEEGYQLGGPFFYAALLVIIYGFFGFFWTRSGQTLGMQAWRIKVVSSNNHLISPWQSVIRFLIAIPALSLAGIGLLWALIDHQRRSWQDLASSSRVILLEKPVKKT
ncbi:MULTISPECIES: RDD family protein [Gammaproteobacteria]|uniref:RDD family protein n=1 Tax=Gammaproteobacteria TaxID=1236 RepID=UPI001ADACCEB|nr:MULTISPECIES: RDD family protein [Gammaproteobacteria]MBO9482440.1 RDD family protein [Salinisphaera sp. G21_0]MBO9493027.1 RDD family protein [Thalassotalea sp. G20_0]